LKLIVSSLRFRYFLTLLFNQWPSLYKALWCKRLSKKICQSSSLKGYQKGWNQSSLWKIVLSQTQGVTLDRIFQNWWLSAFCSVYKRAILLLSDAFTKAPKNLKKPRNSQCKIEETTGNLIAFTSRNWNGPAF